MLTEDAVKLFLTAREAEGRTTGTIGFYRERLSHLPFNEIEQITPDALRRFFLDYGKGHATGGTHALYRATKALLNFIEAEEVLDGWRNPIRKVRPPKIDRQPVLGVTVPELQAMLAVARPRDKAILLVMYDSGVRAGELIGLHREDVDETGKILIRKAKSRKPRYVFIGPRALEMLSAYLATRTDDNPQLFTRRDGQSLKQVGLREIFRRLTYRAHLDRQIHPHLMRHAMAVSFTRAGGGLAELQELMGHSSPIVTRRYLRLETEDLQAAFCRSTPSAALVL